jgi:hypothetical protein
MAAAAERPVFLSQAIAEEQKRFSALPFFRRLEANGSLADARTFIPALTFFVLCFQDVLRLNEQRFRDPRLRALAQVHRREDAQHEQWFLEDVQALGLKLDLAELFSPAHAPTRDASYAVMSEVFRADHDVIRLALILVLESTGEAFFSRVPRYVERVRAGWDRLRYFSRAHADVEKGHQLLEDEIRESIDQLASSPELAASARTTIARTYAAMTGMVQAFEARISGVASRESVSLEARE